MSASTTASSAAASTEWHILTCEYAPRIGGISDFTQSIAARLGAAGRVHVWCPDDNGPLPNTPGVIVHREFGHFGPGDLRRAGRLLNKMPAPRRIFVQWVPHGYGYKSINLPFAFWIAARAWLRGDEIQLMVHEPFIRFSRQPLENAASLAHRLMFSIAASGAHRIWLSIPGWQRYVRRYVRRAISMDWLPIPAAIVGEPDPADARAARSRFVTGDATLLGHFSAHSPVVTRLLEPVIDAVLRDSNATVLLMGRDSDRFRSSFIASRPQFSARVRATGVLDARRLSACLVACDLMVQPFPDGLNARHTSMLTSMRLGRCVVSNRGTLTEDFWNESRAVALADDAGSISDYVLKLLNDATERIEIGRAAADLYDRLFDGRHAVSMLQQSVPGAPPVGSATASHVRA